ncbi:MAG: hypothetical protein H0Z32_04480 [Bacillaceae bacterium]|nr:hypothetical protein [Bacillaceae bacterium]
MIKKRHLFLLIIITFVIWQIYYLKNEDIIDYKRGDESIIYWDSEDLTRVGDYTDIEIIKLKVEGSTKVKEANINFTDTFYYIPEINKVFYGIWYTKWNSYAKKGLKMEARNGSHKLFIGGFNKESGTFEIFQARHFRNVESLQEIEQLTFYIYPAVNQDNEPVEWADEPFVKKIKLIRYD